MKAKFTPSTWFTHTFCVVGAVFITSVGLQTESLSAQTSPEPQKLEAIESHDRTSFVVASKSDQSFLTDAAEAQMMQISLGQLAQKNGTSSHVKKLGKMMEDGHSKSLADLKTLAKSKSIALPTTTPRSSNDDYNDLAKKKGKDFDKAYSKMMVQNHEDAIKLYEEVAEDTADPDIRKWASKQIVELKAHLAHAKECHKKVNA
jgi:putative membrane protein